MDLPFFTHYLSAVTQYSQGRLSRLVLRQGSILQEAQPSLARLFIVGYQA